jgi:hypothetical protein
LVSASGAAGAAAATGARTRRPPLPRGEVRWPAASTKALKGLAWHRMGTPLVSASVLPIFFPDDRLARPLARNARPGATQIAASATHSTRADVQVGAGSMRARASHPPLSLLPAHLVRGQGRYARADPFFPPGGRAPRPLENMRVGAYSVLAAATEVGVPRTWLCHRSRHQAWQKMRRMLETLLRSAPADL